MNKIQQLRKILVKKVKANSAVDFAIPDVWDCFGYLGEKVNVGTSVVVNPYDFQLHLLDDYILPKADKAVNYHQSYHVGHQLPANNGEWIKNSVLYSMMIRTSSAYDHDLSGQLDALDSKGYKDTGTFFKTLMLLPYLQSMGIDVLYLLPIGKYSLKDKKGELGSPYGIANFQQLDFNLNDPMVGDELTIEEQFQTLVEAAHILGMKVIIDIIPRTNSVNSDLILEHPDWFYWIELDALSEYKPPLVEDIDRGVSADKKYFKKFFSDPGVIEHIRKFRLNPRDTDPQLWKKVVELCHHQPERPLLEVIQEHFKLTIAPAFSDCINDPQPAWSDVTYFRLYLDHPTNSLPYLKKLGNIHPYILPDTAKASLNPGQQINQPLWDSLAEIIPYYQRNFGVDGTRIDMGHALPHELTDLIIARAKAIDPSFALIAEELSVKRAALAKKQGYNCIIGDGFSELSRIDGYRFSRFVYEAGKVALPLFACGETHDSPRLTARKGGKVLTELVSLFSYFVPNAIPFVNSGQELYEMQPMNTGLDCRPDEQFVLDKTDTYYGKLALFDRFQFHYGEDRQRLIQLLKQVNLLRQRYLKAIVSKKAWIPLGFANPFELAAGFAFKQKGKHLVIVANLDLDNEQMHYVNLTEIETEHLQNNLIQVFTNGRNHDHDYEVVGKWVNIHFEPGEVKIFEITK